MGWALGCGVSSRDVEVCLVFSFVVLGCCWLFRAVAFSLVLGEVLSVFLFFWALGSCILWLWGLPFGNKHLIIQKN